MQYTVPESQRVPKVAKTVAVDFATAPTRTEISGTRVSGMVVGAAVGAVEGSLLGAGLGSVVGPGVGRTVGATVGAVLG